MLPYPVWESEKKKYKALVSEICVKGNRYRMQGLNAVMFFLLVFVCERAFLLCWMVVLPGSNNCQVQRSFVILWNLKFLLHFLRGLSKRFDSFLLHGWKANTSIVCSLSFLVKLFKRWIGFKGIPDKQSSKYIGSSDKRLMKLRSFNLMVMFPLFVSLCTIQLFWAKRKTKFEKIWKKIIIIC